MGLLNFRLSEVRRAVESKCGIQLAKASELKGWHLFQGRKEFLVLLPDHPGDIAKGTAHRVASQLNLTNVQFRDLVDCSMTADDYRAHIDNLRQDGRI